jgi:hypothetical protein
VMTQKTSVFLISFVSMCHMKILLGDFKAKVPMEDIFKPTIGNENL